MIAHSSHCHKSFGPAKSKTYGILWTDQKCLRLFWHAFVQWILAKSFSEETGLFLIYIIHIYILCPYDQSGYLNGVFRIKNRGRPLRVRASQKSTSEIWKTPASQSSYFHIHF